MHSSLSALYRSFLAEAGDSHRIQCLNNLVLAKLLSGAHVNVLDSRETEVRENDSEIVAMTQLTVHLARHDQDTILRRSRPISTSIQNAIALTK